MSGLKAIRRRITSVKNTKQITRAMKLVSAAKLRRAQDAAVMGRGFKNKLENIISLLGARIENHALLEERAEIKNRLIIVIGADRGLCGGYNTNLNKFFLRDKSAKESSNLYILAGKRPASIGKRIGLNILKTFDSLPDQVPLEVLSEIAHIAEEKFVSKEVDEVLVYYTAFISGVNQQPSVQKLFPIPKSDSINANLDQSGKDSPVKIKEELIETAPAREKVFSILLPLLSKTMLRQFFLESKASEHAARMTAMDSATKNADELIGKLQLFYNRARQSSITRELIDIIGGVEAVK